MSKTIAICGYGPGISASVARRFGEEGFAIALVGRTHKSLVEAVAALGKQRIKAEAFPADLSKFDDTRTLVANIHERMGPITALHWNASALIAGNLMTTEVSELRTILDVGVISLIATVQDALPDLRTQPNSAVLVTGGGAGLDNEQINEMVATYNFMGLAVAKAAQQKVVGLLAAKLGREGIFVGDVIVTQSVKGPSAAPDATLEPDAVAAKLWQLYSDRAQHSVTI
jgi:NAD(P)-dependent dehydrogenase (short-subunit alcohol dehydrogenase family)